MALCNAHLRGRRHLRCRRPAMKGRARCKTHGGKVFGPTTVEGKKRTEAARLAGHKRYIARMHEAKALGIIDKIPGGSHGGSPTLARFRLVAIAKEIIMDTLEQLPAPSEKPFEEQTMGEQLAPVPRLSLAEAHKILMMEHTTVSVDAEGVTHTDTD